MAQSKSDAQGVQETLLGILSYTRWPVESQALRLCVVGHSLYAEAWLKNGLAGLAHRPITVQPLPFDTEGPAPCDALYIGSMDALAWRKLAPRVLGQPVLTVGEGPAVCDAGGMVCLNLQETARTGNVQFEVNLDSVARSGVRLNPRVLRLGRAIPKATP